MRGKNHYFPWVGAIALILFIGQYAFDVYPYRKWPTPSLWFLWRAIGEQGVLVLNLIMVIAFLLFMPYRTKRRNAWRAHSIYVAFMWATLSEMFGMPLMLFMLSPVYSYPEIGMVYLGRYGHWPITVGVILNFVGLALVVLGWEKIYRGEAMISSGIYSIIRHPQYLGILIFTFGWLLHWPTLAGLIMWPVLCLGYLWLSAWEEREALDRFGEAYARYVERSWRFLPHIY